MNFWLDSKGVGENVRDVTVTNNVMTDPTGNLVWVLGAPGGYRGPFHIEGNRLRVGNRVHDANSRGAFFFARCLGVTIRDNRASFPAGQKIPAVELRGSPGASVVGNSFVGAGSLIITSSDLRSPTS
jgi:hypothetical protein